jgi:hypothetical protein
VNKTWRQALEGVKEVKIRHFDRTHVIFYARGETAAENMLEESLMDVVSSNHLEIFRELKDFQSRLRLPRTEYGGEVFVLVIPNQIDLEEIIATRDFLIDIPLILVLPDQDEVTLSKAHSLYPRFLSYGPVAPREVKMVLQRMLQRINSNNKQ